MQSHLIGAVVLLALPLAAGASPADDGRARQAQTRADMRFRAMDTNNDGVITREEWRGSAQSFRVHDWNGDGVLSGDEVRPGRQRRTEEFDPLGGQMTDWTEARFNSLDHDRNGRLSSDEWHYDYESFRRADRNRDNILTRSEFLGADADDERDDRFDYLDANNNGRIERNEWHGNTTTFDWLDRNNDGVITRNEAVGDMEQSSDTFASMDVDRNGRVTFDEWHGSRRSFNQRDLNGDGALSRQEVASATGDQAVGTSGRQVVVSARERWTDTGIMVNAGDRILVDAQGTVYLTPDNNDAAEARGSRNGRLAPEAPLRQRLAGALIAKVGDSEAVFVGSARAFRAPASGRLYFGVNDDYLDDNRGEFRVEVTVQR